MRAVETTAQTARVADELSESAKPLNYKFVRVGTSEEELSGNTEAALVSRKDIGDREWRMPRWQSCHRHS